LKRIAKNFLDNFCLSIKTTLGYHPEFLNFSSGDDLPAPLQGACPSQFSHFQSLARPRLIYQSVVILAQDLIHCLSLNFHTTNVLQIVLKQRLELELTQ